MAKLNPYLLFNAQAEEAFNFYKSVFGGEFAAVVRFKDMPHPNQNPAEAEKIMHIALPVGETVLMASDSPDYMGKHVLGTNFSISISTESEAEATKIFNGLSAGGKITMPLGKSPWGSFFGMFGDKYGIDWMVSYDYPK